VASNSPVGVFLVDLRLVDKLHFAVRVAKVEVVLAARTLELNEWLRSGSVLLVDAVHLAALAVFAECHFVVAVR
jgi:hypothetical protein